ncbi:MAG TPA: cyanophycin synthetase, partial [Streptosporangiaceae bacterium]|nr:cyanophycin synthetase [Streptosporangiaceae bacterium]
ALPAAAAGGVAILNADDHRVRAMASRTEARIVTFGLGDQPEFGATNIQLDDLGRPSFTLITPAGAAPVRMGLHGAHQIPNALAAAATAAELGLDLDGIADGLGTATARSRWRMEVREAPSGVTVINDAYNANPESVRAALDALGHMARGRRSFAVLGQMNELGDESRDSHLEAGAHAAGTGVTALIVVGKQAAPILDGALATAGWHGEAIGVPSGAEAVAALRGRLAAGDVVLVKASRSVGLETVAADLLSPAASSSASSLASEKETAQ